MFWRKLLVGVLVLAFSATAASAYTVVLRSGRQVEIPNTFTITKSTLTYETAPGIQITIQLSSIDVAATERLNNQPGSLSIIAVKATPVTPPPVQRPPSRAQRSITNQDLEVYRRARLEQEKERIELGLPSAEERRAETEAIEDRTQEQIRSMRSQEELDFWRTRAMQLETQMVGAQMNVPNSQQAVDYGPWAYPYGLGLVTSGFPSAFDGFSRFNRFGSNNGFNKTIGFSNNFGFGFNNFRGGHFRGRLLFTLPKSAGGGGGRGGHGHGGGSRGGGRR